MSVLAQLTAALGDLVDTRAAALEEARADRSGHAAEGRPLAIVHAETVAHVQETMRIAIENIYPAGAEVSFSAICEDEGIAEIGTATENGTHYIDITAKRAGDTEITVTETIAGAQSVCPVHVYYPVTAIEFEKESTDVALGMAARITANVTARDRSVVNKLVTFSSGNDAVASVDANGTVTGHAEGTVVITAAAASGVSAQCMVVVRDAGTMRSMVLPSAVKCIEDEAFENSAAEIVILPDGCTQIGARAFAENSRLTSVYMPDSVTVIAGDAFESCAAVTFVCESENDAAAYAADHGIPYSIP